MNLRSIKADEFSILFEIHRCVFHSHIEKIWGWDERWQRENFAAECAAAATSVIEVDGRIAGYIQLRESESEIYVQNIAISPAFQGKGIGSQLLGNLQSKAQARMVPVCLGVFQTNRLAQNLYERLGFRVVGETRTHVEMRWEPSQLEECKL